MTWKEMLEDISAMTDEELAMDVSILRPDCEFFGQGIYIARVNEGDEYSDILDVGSHFIHYDE